MKLRCLLFLLILFTACKRHHKVNVSFYYWKTVYSQNPAEQALLKNLHVSHLYLRVMDVDLNEEGRPIPVSPITFKQAVPTGQKIVPVVFVVNDVLRGISKPAIDDLARRIAAFVKGKMAQSGASGYNELQIDCDWTATTRDNYFYLLKQIARQPGASQKTLSVTLRLHQLKNLRKNGIPPADKVMLMCYNMGNLRLYGKQNSILDINELKKYANDNIADYPISLDVGLPLFSWAVVFRNKQYAGISKSIKKDDLNNKKHFIFIGNNIYKAAESIPEFGLEKADEVRWEATSLAGLKTVSGYLSPLIKNDSLSIIYFHLDETVIKPYSYQQIEEVNDIYR